LTSAIHARTHTHIRREIRYFCVHMRQSSSIKFPQKYRRENKPSPNFVCFARIIFENVIIEHNTNTGHICPRMSLRFFFSRCFHLVMRVATADVFFICDIITHPRKWEDRRRWKSNRYSYWFSVNRLFRRENYRGRIFNVSFTPTWHALYGEWKTHRRIWLVYLVYLTYTFPSI